MKTLYVDRDTSAKLVSCFHWNVIRLYIGSFRLLYPFAPGSLRRYSCSLQKICPYKNFRLQFNVCFYAFVLTVCSHFAMFYSTTFIQIVQSLNNSNFNGTTMPLWYCIFQFSDSFRHLCLYKLYKLFLHYIFT